MCVSYLTANNQFVPLHPGNLYKLNNHPSLCLTVLAPSETRMLFSSLLIPINPTTNPNSLFLVISKSYKQGYICTVATSLPSTSPQLTIISFLAPLTIHWKCMLRSLQLTHTLATIYTVHLGNTHILFLTKKYYFWRLYNHTLWVSSSVRNNDPENTKS